MEQGTSTNVKVQPVPNIQGPSPGVFVHLARFTLHVVLILFVLNVGSMTTGSLAGVQLVLSGMSFGHFGLAAGIIASMLHRAPPLLVSVMILTALFAWPLTTEDLWPFCLATSLAAVVGYGLQRIATELSGGVA
jgi:hypothetical protein